MEQVARRLFVGLHVHDSAGQLSVLAPVSALLSMCKSLASLAVGSAQGLPVKAGGEADCLWPGMAAHLLSSQLNGIAAREADLLTELTLACQKVLLCIANSVAWGP